MTYFYLAAAIVCEVAAPSFLKMSDGMTRVGPSIGVAIGYAVAFYFLSLTLRTVPVGIAYAIWAGAGVVLITLVGVFAFRQALDMAAVVGMLLIVTGVAVIYLFSKTATH